MTAVALTLSSLIGSRCTSWPQWMPAEAKLRHVSSTPLGRALRSCSARGLPTDGDLEDSSLRKYSCAHDLVQARSHW